MRQGDFELQVLVRGKPVNEYPHEGNVYIEGRKGSAFELRFVNHSSKPVLAIPSVDGLSVLNGTPAGPDSPGYLCDAYGILLLKGWTIDSSSVAEFVFKDSSQSYANAMSYSTANVGVIGFMVFREKQKPVDTWNPWTVTRQHLWQPSASAPNGLPIHGPTYDPSYTGFHMPIVNQSTSMSTPDAKSLPSSQLAGSSFDLGTGWGDRQEFKTKQVKFDKGDHGGTLVMYYDSRRNLEKRGIEVSKSIQYDTTRIPQAFPGTGCPKPPGWNG